MNRPTDLPVTSVCVCILIKKYIYTLHPGTRGPNETNTSCTRAQAHLASACLPRPQAFPSGGGRGPDAALTRRYSAPGAPRFHALGEARQLPGAASAAARPRLAASSRERRLAEGSAAIFAPRGACWER